ncbi:MULTISPECIES: hypothetical protein [Pseudomonas]|nr:MULTISPECIES: hypothetical protein [Pseudomonas]
MAISKKVNWTDDLLSRLGQSADADIARDLGISHVTVARKRESLGIKAARYCSKDFEWTPENLALLGQYPDVEVANMLNLARRSVWEKRTKLGIKPKGRKGKRNHPNLAEQCILELGTCPDSILAKKYQASDEVIYRERKRRNIPAFKSTKLLTDELRAELGTITDLALALKYGVSQASIRRFRHALSIPAYSAVKRKFDQLAPND